MKTQTIVSTIVLVSILVPGNVFAGLKEDLHLAEETCTSPYPALAQRGRALLQTLYETYGAKPEINRTISFCGIKKFWPPNPTSPDITRHQEEPAGVRSMEPQLPDQRIQP